MAKVGFFSWVFDGDKTGIGVYAYELVREFIKQGKKDDLCLIHYDDVDDEIYGKVNHVIVEQCNIPFLKYVPEPFKLKKYGFDVLHFTTHWFGQVPHYLFSKSKKVLTVHDLTPFLLGNAHTIHNSHLWTWSFRLVKNKADKIIAVSHATKEDLVKLTKVDKDRIVVIHNGYDSNLFKPIALSNGEIEKFRKRYGLPEDFVLYVGTLEKRKNVEVLIKALGMLREKGKKYTLVVVGKKGWKYENVFRLIRRYKLKDQIIFTGYVPKVDLPMFYNLAKVFVYPSLYEGFGLPPLEAMACGCPVISSNVSSIPEVVGDAGILINPRDADELAKNIEEVMESETLQKELMHKGMHRAKKFSWEKSARRTWEVYEEVLKR